MRPNPLIDAVSFLTAPAWTTAVIWLLLIGAVVAATLAWRADPEQRTAHHVAVGIVRVFIGIMWWQQSLWKIPPNEGGLMYWMEQMVKHASTQLQSTVVHDFVLPHIAFFGPLVYAFEVFIGASLILGLLTRLGSVLGLLMAINLWLGLYSAPHEWPWTYFFIVVFEFFFLFHPPGRSLGFDALLWRRRPHGTGRLPKLALIS